MFKSLSCSNIGVRASLAESLALAQKYGFEGVDFNISEATNLAKQEGVDSVHRMFSESGVRPGSFSLPLDFRKDTAAWRSGMDALPGRAKVAADLGATASSTWLLPASDELSFAENMRWHIKRLRPAARILADNGIRLGLEFVGPATQRAGHHFNFVYSLDGMLGLCYAIGGDNVGLLLDAYHWYTSHGILDDLAKLSTSDVVVVHVNDALPGIPIDELPDTQRTLPGETGVIDLVGFMQALAGIGYDGPVIIEPFSQRLREMPPDGAVQATKVALDELWIRAGLANL